MRKIAQAKDKDDAEIVEGDLYELVRYDVKIVWESKGVCISC